MKKSDLAMIVLIASLSVMAAYFLAQTIIGDPSEESVQVKTAELITAEVAEPDPDVFNKDAINPTVEVMVGDSGSN